MALTSNIYLFYWVSFILYYDKALFQMLSIANAVFMILWESYRVVDVLLESCMQVNNRPYKKAIYYLNRWFL